MQAHNPTLLEAYQQSLHYITAYTPAHPTLKINFRLQFMDDFQKPLPMRFHQALTLFEANSFLLFPIIIINIFI